MSKLAVLAVLAVPGARANAQKALEGSGVGSWDGQAGDRAPWWLRRGVGRGPAAARLAPFGRVCYGCGMDYPFDIMSLEPSFPAEVLDDGKRKPEDARVWGFEVLTRNGADSELKTGFSCLLPKGEPDGVDSAMKIARWMLAKIGARSAIVTEGPRYPGDRYTVALEDKTGAQIVALLGTVA